MRVRPESIGFTLLLGGLNALPPLAVDMALPALPAVARDFAASPAAAGFTLSLFMAGHAAAQLLFGPLSDRFGRRPVLLAGCGLFTAAGAACMAAPTLGALIFFRLLQGAGAGATMVLAFAIVRDLFEGAAARAKLSYVGMLLMLAPMIAPTLGAIVLAVAPWRAIYAVLTLAGLLVTAIIALGLAESHRAPDRRALAAGRLVGNFARALGSRACFGNALLNCLSFGGLFAYISASPLLLMGQLGASARLYGVLFAVTSGAIMAGAALNGRLARRHVAPGKPLGVGLGLAAASAVALLGVTLSGHLALAALLPLLIVNTFAFGLVAPNAAHAAIEPMPDIAGVAAAVVGFLQMFLGGALGSAVVAWLYPWLGASAITASMTGFALAALGCSAWVTRRPAYLPGVVTM